MSRRETPGLEGLGEVAAGAAVGVTRLVEEVHQTVLDTPGPFGFMAEGLTGPITRLVYRILREALRLSGAGLDAALAQIDMPSATPTRAHAIALAVLNGIIGDSLAQSGNKLALPMRLRHHGQALTLEKGALARLLPQATGRIVVLVHGLCMSDLQWSRQNHDHGAALARDLGFTPVYLSYNSGLHISANGRQFSALLEELLAAWPAPVEELALVGHSMGGLVIRSACHYAEAAGCNWRRRLRKAVFLGTPHHGAPLERIGNWTETVLAKIPFARALVKPGRARSAGITDLRHGAILDEDWQGRDRFEKDGDPRRPVPLPEGVDCYAVAGTWALAPGGLQDRWLGDGLVPVDSALGRHLDPERNLAFSDDRRFIVRGVRHLDLLRRKNVYDQVARWLTPKER
jgi:pimeloyl-ACP methyl ester carboxylesterase